MSFSEEIMQIRQCMTTDVQVISPDDTVQHAARLMARIDAGALPVANAERMVGMITDRDIAIRAIGEGFGPDCLVCEVMTPEVLYCFEDQESGQVLSNMADVQVRRLPVVDREKHLVGIVSLGDLDRDEPVNAGHALKGINQPGGRHSQQLDDLDELEL
jgi:CBS domain-containing protein